MTGETRQATAHETSGDIKTLREQVALTALKAARQYLPDGELPKAGVILMFPTGFQYASPGAYGEAIKEENPRVGVDVGLVFGPAKRPGYYSPDQEVPDKERFTGVIKGLSSLYQGVGLCQQIGLGRTATGNPYAGVPVANFYLHGFSNGAPEAEAQTAGELAFTEAMLDLVTSLAAEPPYPAVAAHAQLGRLMESAATVRSPASS